MQGAIPLQMRFSNILGDYTQLYIEGEHTAQARLNLLEDHRDFVENQIKGLISTEKMLKDIIAAYKEFISKRNTIC